MKWAHEVEIDTAYQHLRYAERLVEEAVERVFPPGQRVTWMHRGEYRQTGIVIRLSDSNVFVSNDRTGRELWKSATSLRRSRA